MKYTKLFNEHSEYVAYTASTAFIRPNVSYCIQEDEPHCTPSDLCQDGYTYEVIGTPSYPQTVAASATSFDMSFDYNEIYTTIACEQTITTGSTTAIIQIEENQTTSARTVSGVYMFNGIAVPYSLTQEGSTEIPYSQRYLTFDVVSGGTILWVYRNNVPKTISYSINNGEWTEITSTTAGTPINVSTGDKVRFKGNNTQYATARDCSSRFSGGTALYNAEGNIMSLIGGDDFTGLTSFNGVTFVFHNLFNDSNIVSAKNLIMPVTTMTPSCYRAMFAHSSKLTEAPELPATTLAVSGYWYTFQECVSLEKAPVLSATTLVTGCYVGMFENCSKLNYIKCLATNTGKTFTDNWVGNGKGAIGVSATGTFVKDKNTTWGTGPAAIPTGWIVQDDGTPDIPTITCNGLEIELTCGTQGADIYYQLDHSGGYTKYITAITMTGNTYIECYSEKDGYSSVTINKTCEYDNRTIYEYANESLDTWTRGGNTVTLPNSVNAIDGHSSNYAKGSFDYETSVTLRDAEPTYLWFQHADHKTDIYVNNTIVDTHYGGYNAFFSDISNYVRKGENNIKVELKNNNGSYLAPADGDFNFNATLGKVKLFTSPYMPSMNYGYDGFHITSTVSTGSAIVNVATTIPTGATVVCTISGTNCNYTATSASTGEEIVFTTTITNPHLWNGTVDPYLYNVKVEIYHDNELYHRYERPYGLRFYEYVINDTVKYGTAGNPYTGFLLNGQPYLLRGCCMHDDIEGKANALNDADYTQQFNLITELGLNFLRLAHYPHPKEVYDWCDRLGIVVETEVPCVNKMESTLPTEYYDRLNIQYSDMVNQHYNHPCILFWGLSNETKTNDTSFAHDKIEGYTSLIKSLDSERMVGYVMAESTSNPYNYYNQPSGIDWLGCNIYVGWYSSTSSNNPTNAINTRINNVITNNNKALAYSEYGCGGTQQCHSDSPNTTTNKGKGGARHDIEYMMWLHEGQIAAIKNYPQLMFTSQWVLFDFAVQNRNEGYTACFDGENTYIDEYLRRLNDKGLVERDHVTKKDVFYLYKAWWNPTPFVHICGKDYEKTTSRVIKCYTNESGTFTLYVNNTQVATATSSNYIVEFSAQNFNVGDVIRVDGSATTDTFTFVANKLKAFYNNSPMRIVSCNNNATLTTGETRPSGYVVSAMTTAEVGNCVTTIGTEAFRNCSGLTSVTIPTTVTSIGNGAFWSCTTLKSIVIPNSVTSIGNNAFRWCLKLSSCTMSNNVTTLGTGAFYNCSGLTSIDIPSGVTTIGTETFYKCFALTSIDIPSGVTSIGNNAFNTCSGLTSITVNATVPPTLGTDALTATNDCPIYVPSGSVEAYKTAWSEYASRIQAIPTPSHDYVEIGGIKWATMNVGANSVTDTGLYFQWADTSGYTASQVGSGSGQKYFGWEDYKYGNGTSSPSFTGMTKYNDTDNKTVLESSDDAATSAWGGNWRTPTRAEFQTLINSTTSAWTADYQGSGVPGVVLTDSTDNSKTLFLPAVGYCYEGSVDSVGSDGFYWTNSIYVGYVINSYNLYFDNTNLSGLNSSRNRGFIVRPILDE